MFMKYLLGVILAIIIILLGWFVLIRPTASPESNTIGEQNDEVEVPTSTKAVKSGIYTLVPEESEIVWTAQKPRIPGYVHTGTMEVKTGILKVDTGGINGEIILDMNQVKLVSLGGGKAGNESKLETHLKSGDFFDVAKYPTSTFVITQATKDEIEGTYTLNGSLTMKDVTHDISFPAQVFEQDEKLHLTAQLEIDRTQWNITFGSANFFDSLAENAIGDTVGLSLDLVAIPENE